MLNFSTDPKPMKNVMQRHGLGDIMNHLELLASLNAFWQETIPKALAPHTSVMNLDNGQLVVATDNAAWATRLRYLTPEILTRFNQQKRFGKITDVKIKVIN